MLSKLDKARQEFARAQYLERGEGRPTDLPEAVRLYRRAALRGLADAQHALGFLYAVGHGVPHDETMATAWFTAAAEQGHASAQHNLGVMYAEGRGIEADEQAAVYWFYRAALNGSEISRDWISATRSHLRNELAGES